MCPWHERSRLPGLGYMERHAGGSHGALGPRADSVSCRAVAPRRTRTACQAGRWLRFLHGQRVHGARGLRFSRGQRVRAREGVAFRADSVYVANTRAGFPDPRCPVEKRRLENPDPRCPAETRRPKIRIHGVLPKPDARKFGSTASCRKPTPRDFGSTCPAKTRARQTDRQRVLQKSEPSWRAGSVSCKKSSPVGRVRSVSCRNRTGHPVHP